MRQGKDTFYCRYIKRILDICCALAAMIVFCWLYAIVAILVRAILGSPVIFKQERPGIIDPKTGKETIFCLRKFRTMTDERDSSGELLPDEDRLTKFGRFLRSTSLDELPEAWSILKGDMSVVGPRPLLVKYLPRYSERQHHRHDVKPGLSGWAQVNGRNTVTWEEKFERDVWYAENVSFALDVRIVIETVFKAFVKQEGISSETDATMGEFTGSKTEASV